MESGEAQNHGKFLLIVNIIRSPNRKSILAQVFLKTFPEAIHRAFRRKTRLFKPSRIFTVLEEDEETNILGLETSEAASPVADAID